MKCLHGFTHSFGISETPLSLCMDIVLEDLFADVRFVQGLRQPQFSSILVNNLINVNLMSMQWLHNICMVICTNVRLNSKIYTNDVRYLNLFLFSKLCPVSMTSFDLEDSSNLETNSLTKNLQT